MLTAWRARCIASSLLHQHGVSKLSCKHQRKHWSYQFKHFPLGFISSLTPRSLPGLIGLPGNLLLHRWLGRMTAQRASKCIHGMCQITVLPRGLVSVFRPNLHCLVSSCSNTPLLWYCGDSDKKEGRSTHTSRHLHAHFILERKPLQVKCLR